MKPVILIALLLWLGGATGIPAAPTGTHRPAPNIPKPETSQEIELRDVDGVAHRPLENPGSVATVLFFIAHDCPIANSYAPEINRLCGDYAAHKIAFYVVYVEADLAAPDAKFHAREHQYPCPALLDPRHELVKRLGAKVTPETAVLGPDKRVLYQGRIDDRYLDFGKMRHQPSVSDLRLALDAILDGKPVAHPRTKAIGCYIPDVKIKPGKG